MKPGPPKSDDELLGRIEAWKKELRHIEQLGGPELNEHWRKVALLTMLHGEFKEKIQTKVDENADYMEIIAEVERWAERKRLESHEAKRGRNSNEMEIGMLGGETTEEDCLRLGVVVRERPQRRRGGGARLERLALREERRE